jgi:hypothetical protein
LSAPAEIYLLCLAASLGAALLLARAYTRAKTPLLLWTAVSFGFFALNNLLLTVDLIALPRVDLSLARQAAAAAGLGALIYGFIWDLG